MIDYGALPPEINSARMYAGAGSGPMLAAAGAWDVLAQELNLTAAALDMTIVDLTTTWRGPSAAAMSAAALPFTTWFKTTAAQAELAATQAKAAAAAFEAAFAMTVPPPAVLANRVQLMTLVATNFFGQNTPAIAATEAQYAAMWAQDATAMYAYVGGSAAATQLTEFAAPPQTTNPAGPAGQAAAATQAAGNSATSQTLNTTLQSLSQVGAATASPTTPGTGAVPPVTAGLQAWVDKLTTYTSLLNFGGGIRLAQAFPNGIMYSFSEAGGMTSALKEFGAGLAKAAEATAKVGTASISTPGFNAAGPSAAVGRGMLVGGLSVPQSWPVAPSSANQAAATLVSSRVAATAASEAGMMPRGMAGMGGLAGLPAAAGGAGGGATGFRFVPRYGYRHRMMQRPPSAG